MDQHIEVYSEEPSEWMVQKFYDKDDPPAKPKTNDMLSLSSVRKSSSIQRWVCFPALAKFNGDARDDAQHAQHAQYEYDANDDGNDAIGWNDTNDGDRHGQL